MNHKGTSIIWIPDRHIILRRFTKEDTLSMFINWASDSEVTKYLTWDAYSEAADVGKKINEWIKCYNSPSFYCWAIEYEGDLIGSISAKVRNAAATDRAELGYCIGKKWWNKGIMTDVVKAVMDYMFSDCGAHSCGIEYCEDNITSGRIAFKCGMNMDGIRPEYFKAGDGTWQNVVLCSILESEWKKLQSDKGPQKYKKLQIY